MRGLKRFSVLFMAALLFGATLATAGSAAAASTTIFQIGDVEPGASWTDGMDEFSRWGWRDIATYDVDIATPGKQDPSVVPAGLIQLDRVGVEDGTIHDDRSVAKLNISFDLPRDYANVNFTLAKFGVESDVVVIDGGKKFTAPGAGEGVRTSVDLAIGSLSRGSHTISITLSPTSEPEASLTHVWDALVLTGDELVDSNPFIDDDDSVFESDIEWMAAVGITKGCNPPVNNRFCPDGVVTRGQMAAFLNRALDLPAASRDWFDDDNDSVFEGDINRLAEAGITKGCNPPVSDRFCPDGKVTREQMAAFLVRALNYTDDGGGDLFTDDDDSIFEGDIDRLGTAGVTRGCNPPTNDRFCPTAYVTRGQMAAFLHRALG